LVKQLITVSSDSLLITKSTLQRRLRIVTCCLSGMLPNQKIHLHFTDDSGIIPYQKQYKHKKTPTDVLSFPYAMDEYLGDIVISVETVYRQALYYGVPKHEELTRVIIHGILHLLGFTDTIANEKEKMWQKQESLVCKIHPPKKNIK